MRAVVYPGNVGGQVAAPPSKSMQQRAYAAALLHKGTTVICNAGNSDDERAALQVIQQLGATIASQSEGSITITSNGINPTTTSINCGESGLAARLFTPIAALHHTPLTIAGSGSLTGRPMPGFSNALQQLGVTIHNFSGHLPITLQGPLQPKDLYVDATSGSQFLSGLLFAISYSATAPVTITVESLTSKPYIDLTIDVLKKFGKGITHNNYKEFYIDTGTFSQPTNVAINIEGDWSGAANLLVAGAIAGGISVTNLNPESKQADRAILHVLSDAGANITIDNQAISVTEGRLRGFDFDATHCPDLFPILSILAACSTGDSNITGVHRLFHKESNRAESISEMLQNFDVPFFIEDDVLCISGVQRLHGTVIDSYHDHRIAMAAAIGALRSSGPVDITDAGCVNKSYPLFFQHLSLCGASCTLNDE